MSDAICKHCGHVHKKLVGDRGFSILHALEKISECCPAPFYVWIDRKAEEKLNEKECF